MKVAAIIVTRGDQGLLQIETSLPDEWDFFVWDNGAEALYQGREEGRYWNVSDLSVYGRYAAIEYTDAELIYVQDDDCVVSDPQAIVNAWVEEGARRALKGGSWDYRESEGERLDADLSRYFVVCNMPPQFRYGFYEEHALVGFGAAFHRDAPQTAFDLFERGCGVTTYLAEEPDFKRERQGDYIVQSNSPHRKYEPGRGWLTVADFHRTCDVVFTALTPRVLVDVPVENLPWASGENRMYRQPGHQAERGKMLELAFRAKEASA